MVDRVYCETCEAHHTAEDGVCVNIEPRKAYDIADKWGESTYRVAIFSRATVEGAYGPVTPDNAEHVTARLV